MTCLGTLSSCFWAAIFPSPADNSVQEQERLRRELQKQQEKMERDRRKAEEERLKEMERAERERRKLTDKMEKERGAGTARTHGAWRELRRSGWGLLSLWSGLSQARGCPGVVTTYLLAQVVEGWCWQVRWIMCFTSS